MSLENLNQRAANRFEELRRKRGWTIKIVEEAAQSDKDIDVNKVQKMLDTPPIRTEVENIIHHDVHNKPNAFDTAEIHPLAYIDSLGLPANLSIAVACIIEYGKKKNGKSLVDAAEYIEKEIRNG